MKKVFRRLLLPSIYGIIAAVLLSVAVQLPMPVNAQGSEAEFWAVIVGVADYENLTDLTWADDDARDIADELSLVWGDDHVYLLTDSMATKQNIQNAITNWLAQREDADDVVLFFYSGRSYSAGYLAPHDSLTTSYANDISANELNGWLDTLNSDNIVLMNLSGYLLNTLSKTGRIVLTPNASGEDNWATSDLDHGVFVYFVLEALYDFEGADSDNNSNLSVEEIYEYARPRTTDYTSSDSDLTTQHPQMYDGYGGELNLFTMATVNIEVGTAQDINVLSVDGKTYSSRDFPVFFTWAPNSHHNFTIVPSVSGGSGIRYVFNSWNDGNTSTSGTISLGGVYTINYATEYYLTIESDYGQPQGIGWYDQGSTASMSIASVQEPTVRHNFIGWSGDYTGSEAAASIIMTAPKTVTADWQNEYLLTIESAYGEPEGEGWYDEDSTATISIASVQEPTVRHNFIGWSGDCTGSEAAASIIMTAPKTVTADWQNEYLLTIESAYGEPEGEGWYDEGSTATISIPESTGAIVRQFFTGWSGDFDGTTTSASFTVNSPMVVTANWRTDYLQLYIVIIAIVVILGAFGAWFIIRRRRTAPISLQETTQPPTSPMRCANCGAELEPGDAFCIKCGQPVKDN